MAFLIIIIVCYFVIAFLRKTSIPNEILPLLSGSLGLVLSILALYFVPSIVPETSVVSVCMYGFGSGLAATGSNQVFKQICKYFIRKYNIKFGIENTEKDEEQGKE